MEENEEEWKKMRRNGRNKGEIEEMEEIEEEWKKLRRNGRK